MSTQLFRSLMFACLVAAGHAVASDDHQRDYQLRVNQYVDRLAYITQNTLDLHLIYDDDYVAEITLHYSVEGQFIRYELTERSGNPRLDAALDPAIRKAVKSLRTAPIPPKASGPFSIPLRLQFGRRY